jgi:phage repressor protein C with HTH and peptisase S24 domain
MTQHPRRYPDPFARMRSALAAVRRAPGAWGVVVVRGRSMRPTLYDGDRLVVRHGAVPRPGRLAVVRLPDGVLAVKRVTMRRPDGWWVERDNPVEGVDSWLVGAIPDEDVVAVVRARLWPRRRRPL